MDIIIISIPFLLNGDSHRRRQSIPFITQHTGQGIGGRMGTWCPVDI